MSSEHQEELKETLETQTEPTLDEYKRENEELREKLEEFERENAKLRKMLPSKKQLQTDEFWKSVESHIAGNNVHHIKSLINEKTIHMFDMNPCKQTLLLLSAKHGSYKITQLCLSLGCDINHRDTHHHTAMDYAIQSSFYHIQRLLLHALYNKKHIDQIETISAQIKTQTLTIDALLTALNKNNKSNQNLFRIMFVDVVMTMIHNKLPFSDDILMIAWTFTEMKYENPLQSELWQTIEKSINQIVECGTPSDWYWLNTFIIPSKLWFKSVVTTVTTEETKTTTHLYYKLLHMMINIETEKQRIELEQAMALLADEDGDEWKTLTEWNIKEQILFDARQDRVPNGLRCEHSVTQLQQLAVLSSTDFDVYRHYDYHEYLSKLILLAHSVDADFHTSIQHLFDIDSITNMGCIGSAIVNYIRCDIPCMSAAQMNAQMNNKESAYPVTAHSCDFNKCVLVFEDISSLLCAADAFVLKIRRNQCGNIISVIRATNGFKPSVSSYASIELNVLIQGALHHNIIGCVEFALRVMLNHKERTKHLRRIGEQKAFMNEAVPMLLSQFLDQNKELFIAANHGDVDTLYRLMSLNKSPRYLMRIDDETGESILLNICKLNHIRALEFICASVSNELFVDRLFYTNHKNCNAIEAVFDGCVSMAMCEIIFNVKEVVERYQSIPNQLFRLFVTIYRGSCSDEVVDFVYRKLELDGARMASLLGYEYPPPAVDALYAIDCVEFHDEDLSFVVIANGDIARVNHFISLVGGEDIFIQHVVLTADTRNITPLEYGLFKVKYKMMKHLLSFDTTLALLNESMDRLYRVLYWLAHKPKISEKIFDFVMNKLFDREKLVAAIKEKSIICVALRSNNMIACKKVIFTVGDDVFIDALFACDHLNTTCIEYAIWKSKLDTIEFIFGMKQVRKRILASDEILFRIMLWCFNKYNHNKFEYIWNALHLDDTVLRKLLVHKSHKPLCSEYSKKARTYWDKSLVVVTVNGAHLDQLKYFARLDIDLFVSQMFEANKSNLNPLEFLIKNEKIGILRYVLSIKQIKHILQSEQEALFRCMYWMFFKYNAECFDLIVSELQLSDKLIISLLNYKATKKGTNDDHCFTYWTYNFVHAAISNGLGAVKKLMQCIGEDLLRARLFDVDPYNVSCLEVASVVDADTFKFVFGLAGVCDTLRRNQLLVYRLVCHCCRFGNDECFDLIVQELMENGDETLKELLHFEYPREYDDKFEQSKFKQTYYDKTLLSWAILGGKAKRIHRILALCDDKEELIKYLLKSDVQGRRPFIYCVKKKKYELALEILKYCADTQNQLKLISIAQTELNDDTIHSKFEQMIVQNQKEIIRQKEQRIKPVNE
eukprot:1084428_1